MTKIRTIVGRILYRLLRKLNDAETYPLEHLPNAPDLFRHYRRFAASPELRRKPGGWEYLGKFYPDHLTVGGAAHAIFRTALLHCLGRGIDVGAGLWPLPGSEPIDLQRGPGLGKTVDSFPANSLDYVFSSHCLEHIAGWGEELSRWCARIRPGGIIFLYLPHPFCDIWLPGSTMVGDEHKWQPTPASIKGALVERGFQVVAFDDGPDAMMSFFVCARKQPHSS